MTKPTDPLFDNVEKALSFAFNLELGNLPAITMNKMMAEGPPEKLKGQGPIETPSRPSPSLGAQPGDRLSGLDRAAQAGFILQLVARLDRAHQNTLAARLTRHRDSCSCRNACCRGWRPNKGWSTAIYGLCELLQDTEDAKKATGKRGFSTDPKLRKLLVERFFYSGLSPFSTTRLAETTGVSHVTVVKHNEWSVAILEAVENEAWQQIGAIFDAEGVTGWLP